MKNIAIIGGGPAGVFCAFKILENAKKARLSVGISIFDKDKPLWTLLPTGNGRCNLSFAEYDYRELASYYPRGEKFLYSVFSKYGVKKTLEDFRKIGVETYIQDDRRIFPTSNKAKTVRDALLHAIKNDADFYKVEISTPPKGYDATVLAIGMKSDIKIANFFGHRPIPPKPALCGLTIKEKEFLKLKGVSFNNVIFTDEGISGPFVYKISSINSRKDFPYTVEIPLIDTEKLKEEVACNPKKLFKNVVSGFIPKSLAEILVKGEKQCANTTKKEIEALKTLNLTATGTDGKGEIVHSGGIALNEVDKNLKSKLNKDVWIIGEILDIDGFTGGFNLQACWSCAAVAASDIVSKLKG